MFSTAAFSVSVVRTDGASEEVLSVPHQDCVPASPGRGRQRLVMSSRSAVSSGSKACSLVAILAGSVSTTSALPRRQASRICAAARCAHGEQGKRIADAEPSVFFTMLPLEGPVARAAGASRPRTDRGHDNAIVRQLGPEPVRIPHQRELARTVGHEVGDTDLAADRRDVDDSPSTARASPAGPPGSY